MVRKHAPAIGAALVIVLLATGVPAVAPSVVSSSDDGIVVVYRPGAVTHRRVTIGGREYTTLYIEGADAMGVPGAPDVPVVRLTLAVPDCRDIELAVSASGGSARQGVRVLPALTTVEVEDGEVSRYEYVEGEPYAREGLWPRAAASMTEPRWLSRQRVVHIEFHPCQVDPVRGTLVSHDAIEISLTFHGVRAGVPPRRTSERWERLYRSVLANYQSGRAWRTRPGPVRGRRDEYFHTSSNWLKLTVERRGIYGVGHDDLSAAGVDPATVDPASIRVFTGTGFSIPPDVTEPRPDWMAECTIAVVGGDDDVFDPGDRVAFYAVGTDAWADEMMLDSPDEPYYENRFAGTAVYWMTWESEGSPFADPPLRMQVDDLNDEPGALEVTDYRARAHYEKNRYEFQGRGDNFFMREMKLPRVAEHYPSYEKLTHVVTDSTGLIRARVDGNSTNYAVNPDHIAYFYLNDVEAYLGEWDGFATLVFEADGLSFRDFIPGNSGTYNEFDVFVPRADEDHDNDTILIDWFEFEYWRALWADMDPDDGVNDDRLPFGSSGRTGVLEYSLEGFETGDVSVFKIQDRYTASTVPGVTTSVSSRGYSATFQDDVADTASYLAVSDGGYLTPGIERDIHEGLRSDTDIGYVMIVYDGFYSEALRLKNYRETAAGGGYDVRLVRVSDVYDEFSWGVVDPAAIRDYLKFLSDNADVPPTHALLVGDATSDYRQYLTTGIDCYVPTYYTGGTSYWPTDFWFVGFDAGDYDPEMALGRLSARSTGELSTIIDKIVRYETETVQGIWKNTVVLIGDDEWRDNHGDTHPSFEYSHTQQAEQICQEVLPWSLDRRKIYLMEYEFDAAWHKPAARTDLLETWNDGALILNYTGHGNELLMAHELVFLIDDIPKLKNLDRLPLFFAASCRLNKFDMPGSDSVGELLVKSPVGGSIASIGSTRDSGSGYNSALNRSFLRKTFGEQREAPTVFLDFGQAMQAAFIESATHHSIWLNNTKFSLIADPAAMLVSPSGSGEIGQDGAEPIRRRDEQIVTASGSNAGSTADASGVVLVRVFDTADTSGYIQPQSQYHVEYELPGEVLFEGSAVVTDGEFATEFVVSSVADEGPKGRIRAYFYDGEIDGSLSLEEWTVVFVEDASDGSGPDISMMFEGGGTSVLPGDELTIRLSDDNGINLVNRNPVDGIVLLVNGGEDSTDVTDLFACDLGSFRDGAIVYPVPSLGFGNHTISVAAGDNMGNRSSKSLQFEVVSSAEFTIRDVANYPNPFQRGGAEGTLIMFQLPVSADVTIDIFTVGGRRIRRIGDVAGTAGANEVYWNGRDKDGDELANGVYLYRIHAVSDDYRGDKAEVIGRAVIMR